jgi:alpha-glucosidase (family GH31 glycosyl hydrolase)
MVKMFSYRLLITIVAVFSSQCALGQELYSASAEYRQMLQELHQPAPSPAFLATGKRPAAEENLRFKAHQNSHALTLTTPSLQLSIDKITSVITIVNPLTKAEWTLTQPHDTGCAAAPGALRSTEIAAGHKRWTVNSSESLLCNGLTIELLDEGMARFTFSTSAFPTPKQVGMHVAGSIPLFGLGERFWQAGLSGATLDVRPADKSGEPGHAWVYVAVPFVVSPGGLGLYADTAFDTKFHFDQPGSSFDLNVANSPVSFYVFTGPDPKAVISTYTAITGRPQNPPLWTFGPWINALQGPDAVMEMAAKIRTAEIPASALWVFDEMDEPNNLGWPFWFSSYYGDPRAFSDGLHAKGYKVLGYVHPYVRERMLPYPTPSPAWQKGVSEKLLVTAADGLPSGPAFEPVRTGDIDFTNPAAVDWWQKMITAAVRDQRFDGWMEDFGEWVADTDTFAAGKGTTLSELYPLLYHKITIRIAQGLNPEVAPFSRSGSSGSQQFSPVLWGADQQHNWSRDYGLPSVITAGITAGMSGFSTWGPDILSDGDSKELWMRWAEFAALTPVMRDHVWSKPQGSVNLWSDADTQALFKKYAVLHSALLPYFATYAAEAHLTGTPIMRHTVLEYPNDPRSYGAEYQYLLGEHLLVAPVIEPGATSRKLYLPQGEWVNYWTGDRYTGGQDVTVPAALEQIPLLVRAGSIVPFKPEAETHSFNWSDPHLLGGSLVWKVYLGTAATQQGAFSLPDGTTARMSYANSEVVIDGASSTLHAYEAVMSVPTAPSSALLDGKPLETIKSPSSTDGWWYDNTTHEVHVAVHAINFQLKLSGVRSTP